MKSVLVITSFLLSTAFAFNNPVIGDDNVPDPGAILYQGEYYVITTTNYGDESKFPIRKSKDLQNWEFVGFAFPPENVPKWASDFNDFWAPELHIIDGNFRVYFTARQNGSGILSIGVGSANNIVGPYTDSGYPLIVQERVGSIDATFFQNDDDKYLIFKDDGNGNQPQIPTTIWAVRLNDDGLSITEDPWIPLIQNDLDWEWDVTEGPWIIVKDNWYYLFYSGHGYCDASYAVGVARSRNLLGPYEKKGDPIRVTDDRFVGPGHCSVVPTLNDPNSYVMLYHAWNQGNVCGENNRIMLADPVYWQNGWPYMNSISTSEFLKF